MAVASRISRYTGVAVTVLAFAVTLGFGAFSYGESTRKAEREVEVLVHDRVEQAVARGAAQARRHEAAAVERALAEAGRRARRRLRTAAARAYEEGRTAGYQRGNAAGYAAGRSAELEQVRRLVARSRPG
jgi:hypothetical protein